MAQAKLARNRRRLGKKIVIGVLQTAAEICAESAVEG